MIIEWCVSQSESILSFEELEDKKLRLRIATVCKRREITLLVVISARSTKEQTSLSVLDQVTDPNFKINYMLARKPDKQVCCGN
jgi:hypothetical protein